MVVLFLTFFISRLNPAPIAKSFGGIVEKVMTDSAAEIEEILSNIILKKWPSPQPGEQEGSWNKTGNNLHFSLLVQDLIP